MLKNCCEKFTGKALKLSIVDLEDAKQTHAKLFRKDDNLPSFLEFEHNGDQIEDPIPSEEEIREAPFKIKNRKAPGLSKIAVEDLKNWCLEASEENPKEESVVLWNKVVEIVKRYIRD